MRLWMISVTILAFALTVVSLAKADDHGEDFESAVAKADEIRNDLENEGTDLLSDSAPHLADPCQYTEEEYQKRFVALVPKLASDDADVEYMVKKWVAPSAANEIFESNCQ